MRTGSFLHNIRFAGFVTDRVGIVISIAVITGFAFVLGVAPLCAGRSDHCGNKIMGVRDILTVAALGADLVLNQVLRRHSFSADGTGSGMSAVSVVCKLIAVSQCRHRKVRLIPAGITGELDHAGFYAGGFTHHFGITVGMSQRSNPIRIFRKLLAAAITVIYNLGVAVLRTGRRNHIRADYLTLLMTQRLLIQVLIQEFIVTFGAIGQRSAIGIAGGTDFFLLEIMLVI